MPRSFLAALFAALVGVFGAIVPAHAATLGGAVNPAIGFALSGGVDVADDGTALTILNGAGFLAGVGLPTTDDFDLFVVGDSLDVVGATASLFVDGATGSLEGALIGSDVAATAVSLLFEVISDDFGLFGDRVLLVLTGDFSNGLNATGVSVAINPLAAPTPIPLPAGLPLLATALAGVLALRRRQV